MRAWKRFNSKILLDALAAGYNGKSKAGTSTAPSWSSDISVSSMTAHNFLEKDISGRLSTYPVVTGLDVVVRILESNPRSVKVKTFEQLGYSDAHIRDNLNPMLRRNSGLFVIAGGTGAGKSTTLKTTMDCLPNKEELKRFSVEDPAEYIMPGVRQISIQRGPDDTEDIVRRKFTSALRMLMRMDPDVVMIGEIRDRETGEIASEMAQTGHRVMTTAHGDGCVDVLARLTGPFIGMIPQTIANRKFFSGTMYQKLMATLCTCKLPASKTLSPSVKDVIHKKYHLDTNTMYTANRDGCPKCRIDGIDCGGTFGSTVVSEFLPPTTQTLELIRDCNWPALEKLWRGTRKVGFGDHDTTGKTIFEHALYKASIGIVDPLDIASEIWDFEDYEILPNNKQQEGLQ
jgi:type II secretory ATPase GspE/PulE/Tfp pilus assembly ATPase PilB-like protein